MASCPASCLRRSTISTMTSVGTAEQQAGDRAIYTCSMHPQIREPRPGSCSICGMALTLDVGTMSILWPLLNGAFASSVMLGVYFGVLTLVSGWDFTLSEFAQFWYLVLALALGFGTQISFYTYLKQRLMHHHGAGKVVATSGATSTVAMISCCAHYLVNVLPVIGAAGLVTLVAEYQVELFWVGLAFNAAGIVFISSRIWQAGRHE